MATRPNMRTLQMQDIIDRQRAEIFRLRTCLEIASTAIARDPSRNACWIAGEAVVVKAIENGLDWRMSHTKWMKSDVPPTTA